MVSPILPLPFGSADYRILQPPRATEQRVRPSHLPGRIRFRHILRSGDKRPMGYLEQGGELGSLPVQLSSCCELTVEC